MYPAVFQYIKWVNVYIKRLNQACLHDAGDLIAKAFEKGLVSHQADHIVFAVVDGF